MVRKRGYSEWIMYSEKVPREEYAQLAKTFNPTEFDAGEWMDVNAEAIRGASAWKVYHEGEAIYYTAKENTVYAICTGWPEDGLRLKAFSQADAPELQIKSVRLLGSRGLQLSIPQRVPNKFGLVYKIVTK